MYFALSALLVSSASPGPDIVRGPNTNGALNNPCLPGNSVHAKEPWCNASLPIDLRVADMLARMDLKTEKVPNLNTEPPAIKSLGLNAYNWWSEASSGVMSDSQTTKFAFPITTGMSFNRTLWRATGRQIAHEARALMNVGKADSTFWAPVMCVCAASAKPVPACPPCTSPHTLHYPLINPSRPHCCCCCCSATSPGSLAGVEILRFLARTRTSWASTPSTS